MATVYVYRHRSGDGQTYTREAARDHKERLLRGLNHAGVTFDRMKPYPGQPTELRGIQNRINRIHSGREKF